MQFRTMTAALVVLGLTAAPAHAQQYPTQPVTLVVAFAAGGFADRPISCTSPSLCSRIASR